MRIIPGGYFCVVTEHEVDEVETQGLLIYDVKSEEPYLTWKLESMGAKVDDGRFQEGDLVVAQKSHINTMRIRGNTFYYVDAEFIIKIEE